MALDVGSTIAHYQVTAKIGEGRLEAAGVTVQSGQYAPRVFRFKG